MFVKIFLSFWVTVACFAAAEEVAARLSHDAEQRTFATVRAVVEDARPIVEAYDERGAAGAAEAARAFERRRGLRVDLLDARRTSTIGREVQRTDVELARMADRIAAAGLPNAAIDNADGLAAQQVTARTGERLTLVVGLPSSAVTAVSRALLVSWPVRVGLILSIGGIVCFVVARHLTRPIVGLSRAANALANGRLHTRVGSAAGKRRDELGALARDFDRMAERIEALVAGQRRLLGDASHELRSPLARLTVALGLARQRSNAGADEYLARIEREAGRLDHLIEQLLTLARIETGAGAEPCGPFSLTDIVHEVVGDGDFEARAAGKTVTLVECEDARAHGMAELVRSAIENVVRNAIRYAPSGTAVEVRLTVDRGVAARVSVRDRGPGVDPSLAADIFKPFWTAPARDGRSADGTGLGLAIADRIVNVHAGRVWAANASDGGLTVTIELPLAPPDGILLIPGRRAAAVDPALMPRAE